MTGSMDGNGMEPRADEKRRQLERALERGTVMIHLDARRAGVVVPARFRTDFHLRLNLSLRFEPPDLTVGEWGVRETLSFAGTRYAVAVPWSAIFAITGTERSEEAQLFPEDMPEELLEVAARHFGLTGKEVELLRGETQGIDRLDLAPDEGLRGCEPTPARVPLRVVTDKVESDDEHGEGQPPPAGPRPCHLKLVK